MYFDGTSSTTPPPSHLGLSLISCLKARFQFNNSLFGSFDDPLFQARAAQVALADMDVKVNITNPLMRPQDMFRWVEVTLVLS